MTPINYEALNYARRLLTRDFGDVSDLPESLRNTIVNTYYEYSAMCLELNDKFAWPSAITLESDLMSGLEKFGRDSAHLEAAVKVLPDLVRAIRGMRREGRTEGFELTVSLTLDIFKYRIPNANTKTEAELDRDRPHYAPKVREIPKLWKLL